MNGLDYPHYAQMSTSNQGDGLASAGVYVPTAVSLDPSMH
jgi:hypothetical protein